MMRVAITAQWYLPGYRAGGPVPAVRGMVRSLAGHDVRVIAGDRDLGADGPYPPPYRGWTRVDGVLTDYLGPLAPATAPAWLRGFRLLRGADVVLVNSVFSGSFAVAPLLALRCTGYRGLVVVFPRGELAPSALELGRSRLKRCYLDLLHRTGLVEAPARVRFFAGSVKEAAEIRDVFPAARVRVVGEALSASSGLTASAPTAGERFRLISVGRVAPVKGTLELVQGLAKATLPIELTCYGLLEEADYVAQVRAAIARLPDHVTVCLAGPTNGVELERALQRAHGFVLLSHGESFGHAIGEALQMGLPALLSDQTPWPVAEAGAGEVLSAADLADPGRVGAALDRLAALLPAEWTRRAEAARRLAEQMRASCAALPEVLAEELAVR